MIPYKLCLWFISLNLMPSKSIHIDVVVQSLSCVWLFVTPWTAVRQGFPVLHYLLKFAQTHVHWVDDAMQPSHPLLPPSPPPSIFPSIRVFPMSWLFASGDQTIGAPASVLNMQDWFPLGLTGLISFQSKGLSRVFFSTIVQKHQFFGTQPSLWSNTHIHIWLLGNNSFD